MSRHVARHVAGRSGEKAAHMAGPPRALLRSARRVAAALVAGAISTPPTRDNFSRARHASRAPHPGRAPHRVHPRCSVRQCLSITSACRR